MAEPQQFNLSTGHGTIQEDHVVNQGKPVAVNRLPYQLMSINVPHVHHVCPKAISAVSGYVSTAHHCELPSNIR